MPKKSKKSFTKIKVVGVGGAGCSVIKRMLKAKIPGIEYVAINTDTQSLSNLRSTNLKKIRIGKRLTKGFGTGMDVLKGEAAVSGYNKNIKDAVKGADIIFLIIGLGGGTGTGAGPVIADICASSKALTICILTKPFKFEGRKRIIISDKGLIKFDNVCDALIVLSNNRILNAINNSTPIVEAFLVVDEVLKQGVLLMTDIFRTTGLINVDFSDVKNVLRGGGRMFLGSGSSAGEKRAEQAIRRAMENSLIKGIKIKQAKKILFFITGSSNLKMSEIDNISRIINQEIKENAEVLFGATIDKELKDEIKVTILATGFDKRDEIRSMFDNDFLGDERISQESGEDIVVYGEEDYFTKEKKHKAEQEIDEEELEIPAFLRRKKK